MKIYKTSYGTICSMKRSEDIVIKFVDCPLFAVGKTEKTSLESLINRLDNIKEEIKEIINGL